VTVDGDPSGPDPTDDFDALSVDTDGDEDEP
jgi:hypothetical protein